MFALIHRADHVHDAELRCLQLYGIDIDLDLTILAAEGLRNRCAGNICNLVANRELPKIVQLRFVQPLALQGDQAHRQDSMRRTSTPREAAFRAASRRKSPSRDSKSR